MNAFAKRVLLAGATGYIGRAVAAELLRRGHEVVAVVRSADDGSSLLPRSARSDGEPPALSIRVADAGDADSLAQALSDQQVDAAISCMASRSGVPEDAWRVDYRASSLFLAAASRAGARHFVLLSAICVQRPQLAFQQAKLKFETELANCGLAYTIVRPTAFFKSLSGQVERVRSGKPFLVFGDGTQTACKPIGEADLARFVVDCLHDPDAHDRILPIGGPGAAITPRAQGELLFELTGMRPRFRQVPLGLFGFAEALLSPLGRLFPAAAAKAELARIGRYYATESMLLWDERRGRYDAAATPATGSETLRDYYVRVLRDGLAGQELGAHKLF